MTLVVSVAMGLLLSLSVAQQVGTQHVLCGRTLADMLDLVCAGRGFHFNKRSADTVWTENREKRSVVSGGTGPMRSVVDECCRRACTYPVLESYCAPAHHGQSGAKTDLMHYLTGHGRRLTTVSSTSYTTTQSTAHYDPNAPSAEVFRGPHRGPSAENNRPFFYVHVGNPRVTRNPLITE